MKTKNWLTLGLALTLLNSQLLQVGTTIALAEDYTNSRDEEQLPVTIEQPALLTEPEGDLSEENMVPPVEEETAPIITTEETEKERISDSLPLVPADEENVSRANLVESGNFATSYTISFNSNGGYWVDDQVVEEGYPIVKPENPGNLHHDFIGWYEDPELTLEWDFATPATGPRTLYAKWKINQYTVTFDSDGGSPVPSLELDADSLIDKPTDPLKDGYTFVNWQYYGESPELPNGAWMPWDFQTQTLHWNVDLKATWKRADYEVTFESNGGSMVANQVVDHDGLVSEPTIPTKTNQAFLGWYSDAGLTVAWDFSTAVTADMTLYAKWAINSHSVIFESNGGSKVANQVVDHDGLVIEPAMPTKTNQAFLGWYSDAGLTVAWDFSTAVTADMTLYAKWTNSEDTDTVNNTENSQEGIKQVTPQQVTKSSHDMLPLTGEERSSTTFLGIALAGLTGLVIRRKTVKRRAK